MSKKYKLSITAVILSMVLFLQSIPTNVISVFADWLAETFSTENNDREFYNGNTIDKYNIGSSYIIQENVENRTSTTKEYLLSDDTLMVQQFIEPIHFYSNGMFKEIDNSLVEVEENGESIFKNKANSFNVSFDKIAIANENFVKIEDDGYVLGVNYDFKDKEVKGEIKNLIPNNKDKIKIENLNRPKTKEHAKGQVSYFSVEDNTDIIYSVDNAKLTNQIAINKQQEKYVYLFTLKSLDLQYKLNNNGSIEIYNMADEMKFFMPAPYIIDAKDNYSNNVVYTLNNKGDDTELIITADPEWVNKNASFPVKIISEIKSASSNNFSYANLNENGETIINADKLYAGGTNNSEKKDILINFNLPTVPSYYQLIGTSVDFVYDTKGMGGLVSKDLDYSIYVAESTVDLSKVTYAEKPKQIQVLSNITKKSEFVEKELEYTSEIINPYNLRDNVLTIGIEAASNNSEGGYISLAINNVSNMQTVSWYQRVIGLKDEYSIESFSINGASSHINNGSGQVTSVVNLASVNTLSDMPFEASLIYNDYYNELLNDINNATGVTIPSAAGYCFKLNFQQFMLQRGNVYELIDADGSVSTFYRCPSNGIYYSKDKKLYYDSALGIVYDLVGNQMRFTSGCLTKIISVNYPAEYIDIKYTNTFGEIDKVEYYANSVKQYTIDFTYTNGNLTSVTTDVDSYTPYVLDLYYDIDGNLDNIKNHTNTAGGVQTLSFGYEETYFNSDPVGMLNYLITNHKELTIYDRNFDNTIDEIRNANAASIYGDYRCCSSVAFGYYGTYTKIYYYENSIMTNMRYVSFNNAKEIISEWQQDSKGIVSVQATTNWRNISAIGTSNYIKETCTYYHKSLPLNDYGINANGGSKTFTINASSLEVENHQNYRFAVIFKVVTGDIGDSFLAGINLSVRIGNNSAENIILDYGGSTYVVVPCEYYSNNTSVVITNNGTEYIVIEYFSYTLVNSVQESFTYDYSIGAHKLYSTTTNLRSGDYSYTTYDVKQRISEVQTRDIATDTLDEATTYSYYDESSATYLQKGKIKGIETKDSNNTVVSNTTYYYTGSWSNYTEKAVSAKGGSRMQSLYNINRATNLFTITQTDENNIQTIARYKPLGGDNRLWQVDYSNTREEYAYNGLGQITNINVYNKTNSTLIYSQTDNYDINGIYTGSSYGGTKYTYGYDATGFVTSIGYGGTGANDTVMPLMQYSYYSDGNSISSNKLYKKTYANGNVENYTYSQNSTYNGTVNKAQVDYKQTENGSVLGSYIYNYNTNGKMTEQSHKVNGYTRLTYNYGNLSDLEQQKLTIQGLEFYAEYTKKYDTLNNRIKRTELYSAIGCATMHTAATYYSYDGKGRLSGISFGAHSTSYSYDDTDRLSNKRVPVYYNDIQNEDYVYKTYVSDGYTYTTNLLTCIDDKTYNNTDRTSTYDANGYVTEISYNGNTYSYAYDAAGRLSSETKNGITTTYSYDSLNNIQQTGLTYTNGQLTAVNGAAIVYDAMGNPTTYKGNTFTWEQGRKLVNGSMNGNSFSYVYDGNGMRYKKTVNGTTTCYYYDGNQLLMESKNGKRTWYMYGVTGIEGMICEENHNDSVYYFDKNTLGDIVAIRNISGNIVATYEYDAWGKVTVRNGYGIIDTSSTFIGNVNPFRYRGYYYDTETGFYYLQTRYYDPTICRFINADNYELVAQLSCDAGQLNMYAYCNNNPIMYTDESGEIVGWLVVLICSLVGATIGGTVSGVIAANNGIEGWELVGDIALGSLVGAAGGALLTAGGTAIYAGVGSLIPNVVIDMALVKEIVSLGLAVHNIIAAVVGPLMGVKWPLVEWGPTRNITPEPPSYSNIANLKSNIIRERNDISKYYIV